MPVESRRRGPGVGAVAAVAVAGIVVAVALFVVIAGLIPGGEVEVRLGDDEFRAGDAESQAESIAEDGPLLFSDPSGGDRDIFLQHVGSDPEEGWLAFDARPAGTSRECNATWDADAERFVAPCGGDGYPPDGEGLTQYEVRVEDGEVVVDLRSPRDP